MQPKYWEGFLEGYLAESKVLISLVVAGLESIKMDEAAGSEPFTPGDGSTASENRQTSQTWTQNEVIKLRSLRERGESYRFIARTLGRTKDSVKYKCAALGLKKGA